MKTRKQSLLCHTEYSHVDYLSLLDGEVDGIHTSKNLSTKCLNKTQDMFTKESGIVISHADIPGRKQVVFFPSSSQVISILCHCDHFDLEAELGWRALALLLHHF